MSPKPIDPKDPDIHAAIASMQRTCFEQEIRVKALRVVIEALRSKLCFSSADVEETVARFAGDHAQEIHDELGLIYENGMFGPARPAHSVQDPDRN